MLKKRVIPLMLFSEGRLRKTVQFSGHRDVGSPISSARIYSDQDADELILLNIGGPVALNDDFIAVVSEISKICFTPLSVGGGLMTFQAVQKLFRAGADKVVFNSAAFSDTSVIARASETFGEQAVVLGIDLIKEEGEYLLFSNRGSVREHLDLKQHIRNAEELGIGEIFIQSIDRDGMMQGYDLELLRYVLSLTKKPIIFAGGAGDFSHLVDAFAEGASAVACGSLFNFGDNSPLRAKSFLKNHDIPVKKI